MTAATALTGKAIEHASLIDYARKIIARHQRGLPITPDALQQARAVMAHVKALRGSAA